MLRALAFALLALVVPSLSRADDSVQTRRRIETRTLEEGFLYLGTAPGVNFGGHALPRTLYMDVINAGYVFASGLDLSFALSGMNYFPDAGDYSVSMGRFAAGYRPFLRDPLPMLQPYALVGAGLGGEGRYLCEPEPSCDPATDACRDVCGRSNWRMNVFAGAGIDVTTRLFDVGDQQVMAYAGVQVRYEYMPDRFHMGVVTLPVGLKLQ